MSYFYREFKKDVLNKAYELLNDTTPLSFDCGGLCGAKCCKGDEKAGMLLFPGEKELFENDPDFTVRFDEKYGMYAVYCDGACSRNKRPLACRIFPYMFYCTEKDGVCRITVAPDIRAAELCDILRSKMHVQGDFLRKMRMIAKLFEQDDEMMVYIRNITEIITDFGKL